MNKEFLNWKKNTEVNMEEFGGMKVKGEMQLYFSQKRKKERKERKGRKKMPEQLKI